MLSVGRMAEASHARNPVRFAGSQSRSVWLSLEDVLSEPDYGPEAEKAPGERPAEADGQPDEDARDDDRNTA